MDLKAAWQQAWKDLGLSSDTAVYAALLARYNEPHRHYHGEQHLRECLQHLDSLRDLCERPGEVAIALFFHDAIYAPRRHDNEALSAAWAREALERAGAAGLVAERVEAMIMATRHQGQAATGDEQIVLDIDLAILGASPARFAEYGQQIRREYAWVPFFLYRRKRRAILQAFLDRPRLYGTERFHSMYGAQARLNLQQALDKP